MKKGLLTLVTMILLSALPAWANNCAGLVTMEFDLSTQATGEAVRIWIPYPVSNQDQLVGKIRLDGDYAESGDDTLPANGTPLLYLRREDWPEQDFLIDWLQEHGQCSEVSDADLLAGRLQATLDALWSHSAPPAPTSLPTELPTQNPDEPPTASPGNNGTSLATENPTESLFPTNPLPTQNV